MFDWFMGVSLVSMVGAGMFTMIWVTIQDIRRK